MKNKKRISLLLILLLLISLPVSANTAILQDSYISSWAKSEIIDVERYGIFNKNWHGESFQKPMTEDLAEELLVKIEEKIKASGKEKNNSFKKVEIKDSLTRGGFLRELYNIVGPYESSEDIKKDPIMYFNHRGIVKGSGKKLYLDRKITTQEAVLFGKRLINDFYNKNNLAAKGLLWEAEKDGNKVYMLGSIHLADSSIYPFSNRIMDRFNESEELHVEVDITNNNNQENLVKMIEEISKKMFYDDGKTLKDDIGEDLYLKLKGVMDSHEVEEDQYKNMKPWAVLSQLKTLELVNDLNLSNEETKEQEMSEEEFENMMKEIMEEAEKKGNPADYGIDMYFLLKAKAEGKKVVELESMEFQMNLLAESLFANPYEKMSLDEQINALNLELEGILNPEVREKELQEKEMTEEEIQEMIKNLENVSKEYENQLASMLNSWKMGDAKKLKELIMTSENQIEGLLGDRDKNMALKIGNLLDGNEKKSYFVVVGAAHYVSDGMVIDNLRDMGYTVKSLNE